MTLLISKLFVSTDPSIIFYMFPAKELFGSTKSNSLFMTSCSGKFVLKIIRSKGKYFIAFNSLIYNIVVITSPIFGASATPIPESLTAQNCLLKAASQ
jgi:hypothetical protein